MANRFGYSIVRHRPKQQSIRSNRLSYYKTATGNYYLPTDAHMDIIANAIKADQIYDQAVYDIAKQYIRPNTTVLDVGSNFGQMAILMARLVGEEGSVHAFEADDFVYQVLKKNVEGNFGNIIAHYGAVHDEANETLHFPVQDFERFGSYGSYGIDYVNGRGRPVPTIRIDDLNLKSPISFLKVDVQGGDLLALKGALKTIRQHQMPIVFEYEYLFEQELHLCFQEYIDFVANIGYRFERVLGGHNYLIVPKA